jgi:hypothetical protein
LHNNPQGCGASVASAAEPFTTKKKRTKEEEKIRKKNTSGRQVERGKKMGWGRSEVYVLY